MTGHLALARAGHPRPAARGGPGLPRLLPGHDEPVPVRLADHLHRHGPPPYRRTGRALIDTVAAAGLTGRGGAAFPVHRKLAAVAGRQRPVVIGNGAEGEPASSKDQALLWLCPHLVLDGLQLAAAAVGAATAGLYVRRSQRLHRHLRDALAERAAARLDPVPVQIVGAPPRFLAGEESALASVVAGGASLPTQKPPLPAERGVAGRPTLVQNVETLAHLALIARYGAGWFRSAGTDAEPGSMLATVHRAGGRPDVVEVALGTPLRDLIAGRGPASRAVLVGGYHGAWLAAAEASGLPLANAALRPAGAFVGAGVVAALPADRCGLAETARVVRYLALESSGQCGPCFNGLPRMATALAELARPGRPQAARAARADLERWAGLVEGRGACHHPDGTARLIRSSLRVFGDEAALHDRGRCSGGPGRPFLPLPAEAPLDDADWS